MNATVANDSDNAWFDYWGHRNVWTDSALWRKQMEVFVRLSSHMMQYARDDNILDFGCGSGNFAEMMFDKVSSIVCTDVSEHYVSWCQKKFFSVPNVSVVQVAPDMSDLSVVGAGFTKVVCLSVIHYFRHLDRVAAFVRGMQQVCAPGAKLLIADVGNNRHTWKDKLDTLSFILRERMFLQASSIFGKTWLFDVKYRTIRDRTGYLEIPDGYFQSLAKSLGVKATILETQLTLNANHQNVLIEL